MSRGDTRWQTTSGGWLSALLRTHLLSVGLSRDYDGDDGHDDGDDDVRDEVHDAGTEEEE